MKENWVNYQVSLFWITLLFFVLGMIHISLALLGLLCFTIPFIQYYIYKDKVWCRYYCPRAGLFLKIIGKISFKRKVPKFVTRKGMKIGVLIYFGLNMFFVIMTTLMVAFRGFEPMAVIRFMIVFEMPFNLPQFFDFSVSDTIIHLGYRIYSVMFTSTIVGIIFGVIFNPRTWCIFCPIQTLTTKKAVNHTE